MYKYIRTIVIFILLSLSWATVNAYHITTTDLSYLLPHNGQMCDLSSCTSGWGLDGDDRYRTSYGFFTTTSADGNFVVLRCMGNDGYQRKPAKLRNENPFTIDLSSVKRCELLVKIRYRGSPDPLYGNGTIFGVMQPEMDNIYKGSYTYRCDTACFDPAYLEAVSVKGIEDLGFSLYWKNTKNNDIYVPQRAFAFGLYSVHTSWVDFYWRFYPVSEKNFQNFYLGILYHANGFAYESFVKDPISEVFYTEFPKVPFSTEIHIKEIKLYGLTYQND